MAVTVEGTPSTGSLAIASSVTWSHTTGATATGLFVGGFSDGLVTFSSCTFNGDALTEKWDVHASAGVGQVTGYLMVAPDIGTANVVLTAASLTTLNGGGVGLAGLDQTTPNRTVATASASGGGTGPTVAATSVSGDLVIDSAVVYALTIAVGAGQTSRVEEDNPGSTGRSWGISTETASGVSTTMSWSASDSGINAIGAVALIAAAAAGTPKNLAALGVG